MLREETVPVQYYLLLTPYVARKMNLQLTTYYLVQYYTPLDSSFPLLLTTYYLLLAS